MKLSHWDMSIDRNLVLEIFSGNNQKVALGSLGHKIEAARRQMMRREDIIYDGDLW